MNWVSDNIRELIIINNFNIIINSVSFDNNIAVISFLGIHNEIFRVKV